MPQTAGPNSAQARREYYCWKAGPLRGPLRACYGLLRWQWGCNACGLSSCWSRFARRCSQRIGSWAAMSGCAVAVAMAAIARCRASGNAKRNRSPNSERHGCVCPLASALGGAGFPRHSRRPNLRIPAFARGGVPASMNGAVRHPHGRGGVRPRGHPPGHHDHRADAKIAAAIS